MLPRRYRQRPLLAGMLTSLLLILLLIAAPVSAQTVMSGSSTTATSLSRVPQWKFLSGSLVSGLRRAHRINSLTASKELALSVTLRVRDRAGLNRFLAAVQNPLSRLYHHYLAPGTFVQRFAPTAAVRRQTISWLRGRGLHVVGTSGNGLQITALGTASAVQTAFDSPLALYRQGNHTFVANSRELRVPGSLASAILAVSGLTMSAQEHPARAAHAIPAAAPEGYSPSDIAGLYNLAPLHSQGLDGTGQTIALVSFADYAAGNVGVFDQQFGFTDSVSRVVVSDGVTSGAPLGQSNGQAETESDIEILQSTAPHAKLLVYEAPNSSPGAIALYNRIVSEDRAVVVTSSWGAVESSYAPDDIKAIHQALQEGVAQGQSFLSASGDGGAYDGADGTVAGNTTLAVDYPSSDPLMTGVGGTTLIANGSRYGSETAWSDGSDPHNPVGSGGGLSTVFSRPDYQSGPGVSNSYSNGMRQVPDVAANADPQTGYALYTVTPQNTPRWLVSGGTSASTPLWAGLIALVDEATQRRAGALNPVLYDLGQKALSFAQAPFHDVTQGSNLFYPATVGWDFATGWGSFDAAAFLVDLTTLTVPAPPAIPTPSPTATLTSTPAPTTVSSSPSITIKQVILLHLVKGKLQSTGALRLGETGTLVVLYRKTRAGSLSAQGRISLQQKGRSIRTVVPIATRYLGQPALIATVHFSSTRRIGNLLAHVTVRLGGNSASLDHAFKLVPAK